MNGLVYVFAAYTVIWAALFAYLLSMSSKQRQLKREVDTLKAALKKKE